jgi:hypothetical protein
MNAQLKAMNRKVRRSQLYLRRAMREIECMIPAAANPDDYLYDPRYAVPVSRHGKNGPAVARSDVRKVSILGPDGQEASVYRVSGPLIRMYRNRSINEDMLYAGAHFQSRFAVAGFDQVRTTNLSGAGGGGDYNIPDRVLQARKDVRSYMNALLEPSPLSVAAWWIAGLGCRFEDVATANKERNLSGLSGGDSAKYWRGQLVAALVVMAEHHRVRFLNTSRKRRRFSGFKNFKADDLICSER